MFCRYGMPAEIITDNGTNFASKQVKKFCDECKVQHHFSSPYRPQTNGAVEAANKNLKTIIRKTVDESQKDWNEKLPYALCAYNTSIHASTGTTPYSLVYGMEAVLPIELLLPSGRVIAELKMDESEWSQSRMDQLDLLPEQRMRALYHAQCYQKRMARAYNKKVISRDFAPGDLVLRKIWRPDTVGKFGPNWEGPFIVIKMLQGRALYLRTPEGEEFGPINAEHVRKYYT